MYIIEKLKSGSRLFLSGIVLVYPLALFAADGASPTYKLIAPLGGYLTGEVNLSQYLQGAVQVIIGVAGILAVLMIVICGIKLMGTPSASAKSEAKECIWNAILGLLLAIGAWAILNTISGSSGSLISTDAELTPIQSVSPSNPVTPGTQGPLTISGTTFNVTGGVGTNYSSELGVVDTSSSGVNSGGSYRWTISNGALPPGVSLYTRYVCNPPPCRSVASISGVPTTPGTYTFTASVTFNGVTTSQIFTITVAEAPVVDTSSGGSTSGWVIGTGQALYIKQNDAMLTGEWYAPYAPPRDSYLFFEWGTTASLGKKTPRVKVLTTGDVTWGGDWLSGLTSGATYFYRAGVAPSLTGTPSFGKTKTFVANTLGVQPTVVTLMAYKVTINSASLAAYVATDYYSTQTGGLSGDAYIEWGTDATLTFPTEEGRYTKTFSPGVGANIDAFLTGLTPGTTYYYRGVFKDTSGKTTKSEIFSFKTKGQTTTNTAPKCPIENMPTVILQPNNFGGGGATRYFSEGKTIISIPGAYDSVLFGIGLSGGDIITPVLLPPYRTPPVGYKPVWNMDETADPSLPGDATSEFSISQCPGVIDKSPSDPDCYQSGTVRGSNSIFASPDPTTKTATCYTPKGSGPWYVNIRWKYSGSCAPYSPCSNAVQFTPEISF